MNTGFTFSPASLTVAPGTTVAWQNNASLSHNVTWDDAAGRSAALRGDGTGDISDFNSSTRTRLFNTVGVYGFKCTLHPGMNGTLTVQ